MCSHACDRLLTNWDVIKTFFKAFQMSSKPFDAHQSISFFNYAAGMLLITLCFMFFMNNKTGDIFLLLNCYFVIAAF